MRKQTLRFKTDKSIFGYIIHNPSGGIEIGHCDSPQILGEGATRENLQILYRNYPLFLTQLQMYDLVGLTITVDD